VLTAILKLNHKFNTMYSFIFSLPEFPGIIEKFNPINAKLNFKKWKFLGKIMSTPSY